jgi:hypothetical protein
VWNLLREYADAQPELFARTDGSPMGAPRGRKSA